MPTLTSTFPTYLDSRLAPLKYLTDVVEPFMDEDEGYNSLMNLEGDQRRSVMERLLDEDMGVNDPFKSTLR